MKHFVFFVFLIAGACQKQEPAPYDVGSDFGSDTTDMTFDFAPDRPNFPDAGMDSGRDLYDPFAFGTYYPVTCEEATDGFIRVSYTNEQTEGSFQFVVYSTVQEILTISEVKLPDGSIINLNGVNEFQVRNDYPIRAFTIPGMESVRNQLQVGEYRFRISGNGELCHYVAANPTLGNRFDMNIYFATGRMDAAMAPTDTDWLEVVALIREIYETSDFEIGTITYHDIDPEIATGYRVIETEDECEELLTYSLLPEEEAGNSINLFMVDDMTFGAAGAVHVVNSPAGLHGSTGSGGVVGIWPIGEIGLTLTSGIVIDGNDLLAGTIAHEIGHLFGLRHTSEVNLGEFDPLIDTPQCSGTFDISTCADRDNLMFPGTSYESIISQQQAEMIRLHPSVR